MFRERLGRQVVCAVFLLGATLLAAHTINAYVAYSINQSVVFTPTPTGSVDDSVSVQDPSAMAQQILNGRLFPLPPNAHMNDGTAHAAPPPPPPLDVAKQFSLSGTVISQNGVAMAILEELSSKQQRLYRLEDSVGTVGSLAAIEKDRVLFRKDAQEEWLELLIMKAEKGVVPLPGAAAPVAVKREPPSPSAPQVLDRRYVTESTSDLSRLLTHAQTMPNLADGKIDGFRFISVLPSGFFDRIGLKTNDVVQRINGVSIRDPASLMSVLQQLKLERSVRVDVVRNDRPQTLSYEIR